MLIYGRPIERLGFNIHLKSRSCWRILTRIEEQKKQKKKRNAAIACFVTECGDDLPGKKHASWARQGWPWCRWPPPAVWNGVAYSEVQTICADGDRLRFATARTESGSVVGTVKP